MLLSVLHIVFVLLSGNNLSSSNIKNYLSEMLKDYERIEFKVAGRHENLDNISIDLSKEFTLNGKYGYIPVYIKSRSNNQKQSFLTVELELYKKVFVASDKIGRKEEINSHVKSASMNVAGLRGEPINITTDLSLLRSKRIIKQGSIILENLIERQPLILSGDKLVAHAIAGTVDISLCAFARQEGAKDDIIRIRTKENKTFRAKVLDRYNVLIIE